MEKDKWIDCKEQLPNENDRVLTIELNANGDGYIQICNYVSNYFTGYKLGFMDEQDEQPSQIFPAYWQPLPAPPHTN